MKTAILSATLTALACGAWLPASAQIVPLQKATATSSFDSGVWYQPYPNPPSAAIDGNTSAGGWVPASGGTPATIVFETQNDVGFDGGGLLSFTLFQADGWSLGRFRLSVTTDDRNTFANGLPEGGNVTANWTVLEPVIYIAANGATLTRLADNSLLASLGHPNNGTYTIMAYTPLTHITGFRLEALTDPSLPNHGPGRAANGNFQLLEFQAQIAPAGGGLDGALDTTWAARMPVRNIGKIFMDPAGRVLLSSYYDFPKYPANRSLVRLNPDGSPDTSFYADNGDPPHFDPPWTLGFLSDSKIVFGGAAVNDPWPFGRLASSGTMELGLRFGTPGTSPVVTALALQPDGKIVIGGLITVPTSDPSDPRNYVARFNPDFTVDASFDVGSGPYMDHPPSTGGLDGLVDDIVVQPDGKILVGGAFTSFSGQALAGIVRLNSDGSLDSGFVTDWSVLGAGLMAVVNRLALLPDGRILIAGGFSGNPYLGGILRLNSDGSIDPTFVPSQQSYYVDGEVNDFAFQADGRILIGGAFRKVGGLVRVKLARLNPDGSVDPNFVPDAIDWYANFGGVGDVRSVALQDDGHLIVTGPFESIGGVPVPFLARILTAPLPLLITTQPQSQGAIAGNPVTFSVLASGTKPITYQWRKNGVPIPGAFARTFSLPQIALSDAGEYDVIVANPSGSLTSAAVTLTVAAAVHPQLYAMPDGESSYWHDDTYSGSGDPTVNLSPLSGGSGKLTDGIAGNYSFDYPYLTAPWVGWSSIDPEITFDFGARTSFQQVAIHAQAYLPAGVAMFSHADISFSDDSVTFGPAATYWTDGEILGNFGSFQGGGNVFYGCPYPMFGYHVSGGTFTPTAGEAANGARWISIPVWGSGRFVRLKLYHAHSSYESWWTQDPPWIVISEVMFGSAPPTSPPVPDAPTLPTISGQCSANVASPPGSSEKFESGLRNSYHGT